MFPLKCLLDYLRLYSSLTNVSFMGTHSAFLPTQNSWEPNCIENISCLALFRPLWNLVSKLTLLYNYNLTYVQYKTQCVGSASRPWEASSRCLRWNSRWWTRVGDGCARSGEVLGEWPAEIPGQKMCHWTPPTSSWYPGWNRSDKLM